MTTTERILVATFLLGVTAIIWAPSAWVTLRRRLRAANATIDRLLAEAAAERSARQSAGIARMDADGAEANR